MVVTMEFVFKDGVYDYDDIYIYRKLFAVIMVI